VRIVKIYDVRWANPHAQSYRRVPRQSNPIRLVWLGQSRRAGQEIPWARVDRAQQKATGFTGRTPRAPSAKRLRTCIRMRLHDVEELFELVTSGSRWNC